MNYYQQARRKISLTLEEIMDERWKGDDGSFRKSAFIDGLIANSELSHDDKVTFVLDSLLAGYETTSVLLSMLVYFVGQSPQCLEQLKVRTIRQGSYGACILRWTISLLIKLLCWKIYLLVRLDLRFRSGTIRGQLDPWPLGLNGNAMAYFFTMTLPCLL